ncbi:MAG: electron transfer flavoprotein subunit alpha/FixB family protein [Gammaproteobacteria bacterium]|nr:electron transfer flavoprotein subunit alpha/FixB family protein [Gammaproteobacteria bacterium]
MNQPTTSPKPAGRRKFELDPRFQSYKGVWVFMEQNHGEIHPVSFELLGEGRKLADQLGVELAGIVVAGCDADADRFCAEAFFHGADLCYSLTHAALTHYRNQPYTQVLTDLVNRHQPEILLLGATTMGRDLAGSVATTLQTGLTADCTGLAIDLDNRSLAATRPTFGGSLLCTIVTLNYRPQMATVRPRVMSSPVRDTSRSGRILAEHPVLAETDIITKLLEFLPDDRRNETHLPFADIIVAGGRGLKRPDNFRLVWDLADALGAEVGATRPVVQAGWVTADRQIGQSGKTVRPKLYIAAGISGAVQHRVGMEGADVIIAINPDPDAPIFDFATYGIVANAMQILPALTAAFRQHTAAMKKAV